jgi:hypothetical protein
MPVLYWGRGSRRPSGAWGYFLGCSPRIASAAADFIRGYFRSVPPGPNGFASPEPSGERIRRFGLRVVYNDSDSRQPEIARELRTCEPDFS